MPPGGPTRRQLVRAVPVAGIGVTSGCLFGSAAQPRNKLLIENRDSDPHKLTLTIVKTSTETEVVNVSSPPPEPPRQLWTVVYRFTPLPANSARTKRGVFDEAGTYWVRAHTDRYQERVWILISEAQADTGPYVIVTIQDNERLSIDNPQA